MYSCMTNLFVCVWACPWSCVFRWTSPAGLWRSDVNWKNNHLGSDSSTNSNQGQKSMTRPRIFGHCVHGESCIMHWCYALIPVPEVTDAVTDSKHKRERESEREIDAKDQNWSQGMRRSSLEWVNFTWKSTVSECDVNSRPGLQKWVVWSVDKWGGER